MLEFRGVNTYYGELHVLKDVNYEINEGEIVCLLGGNASGKSTTMKAVLGIVRAKSGDILYEGKPINRLPTAERVHRGIAPVPEARRLFPRMTVFLIEHKLNVVNDLADKIIVLDHGEKIAEGSAEQVHSNPQVLEAYLGRKAAHHA